MFVSFEVIGSVALHIALLLACAAYAAFLAQPHVYKAYHPHNTILTVIGGEMLVGIAFGLECLVAAAWIRAEPLIAAGLFTSLHCTAAIPIARWQYKQRREEKMRERAIEARLVKEEKEHEHEAARSQARS